MTRSSHILLLAGKISPLKRLKPSADLTAQPGAAPAATGGTGNADDAEVARRLHEQLNGPESPTNAPLVRHVTRQRKAPTFYKPEVCKHHSAGCPYSKFYTVEHSAVALLTVVIHAPHQAVTYVVLLK